MDTSSEMTPVEELPHGNEWAMRLPENDSSTCLAWHAFDKDTGRHLFIKQLRPELTTSQKHRSAFIKEYNVGRKLQSGYFPTYHEMEDSDRGLYVTMDFIDGKSLNDKMSSAPRYFHNKQNLLRLIRQLLKAMDVMHRADIVHLDLKPDNIILTKRTNNVRIIDFGYSCAGEWTMTTGMTRVFASPEQLMHQESEIGVASDIYAFGRIIQEIKWQTNCPLPRYLRRIVDKCVNEQPERRYASAQEILEEIDSHIAMKKKQMAKVSSVSILTTCIFFAIGFFGYRHYTQDTFESNGLRYHIMKDVWVASGNEDVVELTGKVEDAVLDSCFVIPNTVKFRGKEYKVFQVADSAFIYNDWIKKVIFPEEFRFPRSWSFQGCKNLEAIEMQQNVPFIYNDAFTDCTSLKSIKISKKNPYLYVEDDVVYLRDPFSVLLVLPSKTGDYVVPQGVREICKAAFINCSKITSVTIPEGVEKIKPNAFGECHGLTSITLPSSLVDIENSVFGNCSSLQHVSFGDRTVILGLHSFENCNRLKEITIPASMIRIGVGCFNPCDSLQTVINLATEPQEITEDVFSRYGDLYVPDASVKAYKKAANWQRFTLHPLSEYRD